MAELTPRQQLLYIGMVSNADDDGRLKGSPVAVSLMLPTVYSSNDRGALAEDLASVLSVMRQLVRYVVEGREYLAFTNYAKWQRIDKPTPSVLPAPPDKSGDDRQESAFDRADSDSTLGVVGDESANDQRAVPPNRKEEKLREEKGREVREAPAAPTRTRAAFDNDLYPYLEELCSAVGWDASDVSERDRKTQLAAAKVLKSDGIASDEIPKFVGYVQSIDKFQGIPTLRTLQGFVTSWKAAGRPEAVETKSRASPNGSSRSTQAQSELDALIRIGRGERA